MKSSRGYSDLRQEMLNPYMAPDVKETYDYGLSIDGGQIEMTHLGLNRWPNEGTLADHGFKDTSVEYLSETFKLGMNLIHAVCLGLDLPEDTLDAIYEKPLVVNRYIKYPPQPNYGYQFSQYPGYGYGQPPPYGYNPNLNQPPNVNQPPYVNQQYGGQPYGGQQYGNQPTQPNEMGAGSHVDFGAFTLLQQDIAGLEILNRENDRFVWKLVPPKEGTFVVNSGYILEKLTNGFLPATKHRVINRNQMERYAIALFLDPNPAVEIEPLSKFVNEENPSRYNKCVSGHKGVIFGNKNIYNNLDK
jgi:isopenicillin N synthase-like dioxygenase